MTICARCARIIGDKDFDSTSQGLKLSEMRDIFAFFFKFSLKPLFFILAGSSDFNSRAFEDITNKEQGI